MALQNKLYSQSTFLKDCNPEITRRTHIIKKLRHTRRKEERPVEVTEHT